MHQASLISMNIIRRLTLSLITAALASAVSSNSITSPDFCLSNLECPTNSFCNETDFDTEAPQLPLCTRRLPPNTLCDRVGLVECKQGFTCRFDEAIPGIKPICRRRASRGRQCRLDVVRPCRGSLICDRNTTTCQPFNDGFAGTPCVNDRDCQQDKGFYCQSEPGVCAPKLGPGGECDRTSDNNICSGFCVSSSPGKCISASKEGELCTEDLQCENRFFRDPRAKDVLSCNVPKGVVGRCLRESRLLTRLGAECDPDHDRCDARRSLSCQSTRRGRHVCQHRLSRFDPQFQLFCEPQSRLSRCPWGDEQTECRRERFVPGQSLPYGPSPFFVCRRRLERVPRGGLCIAEYAACEDGTECRVVPGLELEDVGPFERFPPPETPFCVRIVEKGRSCGGVKDKFTTQCAEGLRCEKAKCVKAKEGEAPFDETVTHGGIKAFCAKLRCAPGLVCEKGEFDTKRRCLPPLRIVGKRRACTDRARKRRRCVKGLVCALRKDGTNVRRCRVPRKAGDFCRVDSDCAKGLICPFVWSGNREQEERRCYNPRTTLKLGQTCDPKATGSQPQCVVNEGADITQPMRCLMKGDRFACRVVVGLFKLCDVAKDITCDEGLKCGNLGVCVPMET